MGTSENDFDDFYHDDPIEDSPLPRSRTKFFATSAVIIGSIFFFQSTFAGNISLNSSRGIEFGQSVSQAVACSGDTDLTLTPRSSFSNGSPGAHYLKSVTVSNIPTSCYGVDFTINAYNDSSSAPLALFNSNSANAVVYNKAGSFSRGLGSAGMTVESGTGTFTATFTAPVAQSSNVFKLTIQSGVHSLLYLVGDGGPGGGVVFYVSSTGFNCGPTLTARCKYLEAAPALWNVAAAEPKRVWSQGPPGIYYDQRVGSSGSTETATATAIGSGYRNSRAIILQGNANTSTSAAALADSYTVNVSGGVYDDWYLASKDELNQMCKWARGVAWTSDATICTAGGAINTGSGAEGFIANWYYSSSEMDALNAYFQMFSTGDQYLGAKVNSFYVRPIRAF